MSQCVKNLFWMNYKIYQEIVGYFVPVHDCVPCLNFNPHIITNHIHDVFMRMVKYMTTWMSHCSEEITILMMWWDFPVVLIMFCCSGISTHWKIEYASFFNKNFHFASERFFFHIKKNTFLVSHCFAWAIILCWQWSISFCIRVAVSLGFRQSDRNFYQGLIDLSILMTLM